MFKLLSSAVWAHVVAEVEHLRAQNAALTDALVRLERKAVGLNEAPAKPRERIDVPEWLVANINETWSGSHTRARKLERAVVLYGQTQDWKKVDAEINDAEEVG